MANGEENDELRTEEEIDEVPYVEFDISVSPSDPSLELLAKKIEDKDIIIPFYQRRYVWKIDQASKLIESFLMGLPVPQVFLYVNDEDQLEVIDGQQRLMSVKYFFEGFFGEEDAKGNRKIFKLKGLSERSEYNGKKFSELSAKDQRKLKNSTLRAINIKQLKPHEGSDSVFHIFERLNTGGTMLKPQEIRNAVYRGPIVESLKELNQDPDWRKILGMPQPDKSQKDVELILRLFSLFEVWDDYEKPMLRWLNGAMKENRNFDTERADRFFEKFGEVTQIINENLKNPFRPKRVINAAVMEAVMVSMLENADIDGEVLARNYDNLLNDEDFGRFITGPTTDTLMVKSRLTRAAEILEK
ncbi:DUF262 domain-containing protein [Parasphingorhabdus sp.]|uniref:DUF262 domain-containing protein n=1 Tax=Parasphingorhabdus sp. TaxID=2709688 RepID=UPI003A94B36F